jgi:hypothetical protein
MVPGRIAVRKRLFAAEILQFQIDHHRQVGPLQSADLAAVDERRRRPQDAALPGSFPD